MTDGLTRREFLAVTGASALALAGCDEGDPMISREGELPGIVTPQAASLVMRDTVGFDGETMNGIRKRGVIRTPANATGQIVYYCALPIVASDVVETNQTSRGDGGLSMDRLVFASLGVGAAAETIFYEWSMKETKAGRARLFEAIFWTVGTPAVKRIAGHWLNSSAVIQGFREGVVKADGTNTGISVQWFQQAVPGITGLTTAYESWETLGAR